MDTSPIRKNKSGSIIHSGERRVIYNVFKYFNQCSDQNRTMECLVMRTASACGVSENTVYKIIREQKQTNTLKSPPRKRIRQSRIDKNAVDNNAKKKQVPSVNFKNEYPSLEEEKDNLNKNTTSIKEEKTNLNESTTCIQSFQCAIIKVEKNVDNLESSHGQITSVKDEPKELLNYVKEEMIEVHSEPVNYFEPELTIHVKQSVSDNFANT